MASCLSRRALVSSDSYPASPLRERTPVADETEDKWMTMGRIPPELPALVGLYENRAQRPVEYIVTSYQEALRSSPREAEILCDDRWTHPMNHPTRRCVGRQDLVDLMKATDLRDDLAIRKAFTLVMVCGSGTSNTRTYRNLPRALCAERCAAQLRSAALACRSDDVARAYAGFSLPGIGRSFFTKWFAFAGRAENRGWQPLILDNRVLTTLNQTLRVSTKGLASDSRWRRRYAAYVQHMYDWSETLAGDGVDCSAERLEWIMFQHNGKALPPAGQAGQRR